MDRLHQRQRRERLFDLAVKARQRLDHHMRAHAARREGMAEAHRIAGDDLLFLEPREPRIDCAARDAELLRELRDRLPRVVAQQREQAFVDLVEIDAGLRHQSASFSSAKIAVCGRSSAVMRPAVHAKVVDRKGGVSVGAHRDQSAVAADRATAMIVSCAASFRLSPFHATRSHTCRAALSRMKYSPDPVAETAHWPFLA